MAAIANESNQTDAFTDSVMRRIDRRVMAALSGEQVQAIQEAVSASRPFRGHCLDVRGVIPLYFARFYFVFLTGRDVRTETKGAERKRKQRSALASGVMFILVASIPILVLAFLMLYAMKSDIGINLFEDAHLSDIVRDLFSFLK